MPHRNDDDNIRYLRPRPNEADLHSVHWRYQPPPPPEDLRRRAARQVWQTRLELAMLAKNIPEGEPARRCFERAVEALARVVYELEES